MKRGVIVCAVLLCALPAQGDLTALPPAVEDALSQIDTPPQKSTLNEMFTTPDAALENLRLIALDHSVEPGVGLRAIRALPTYCPSACGTTTIHTTLVQLIDEYERSPHSPMDVLRLRAAVEALGVMRNGTSSDVAELSPLLGDPSRDVRATVAQALRNLCNAEAIEPLRARLQIEQVEQVRSALTAALRDLRSCP
jgi:hypothetical protein